jgi:hypothetical protein
MQSICSFLALLAVVAAGCGRISSTTEKPVAASYKYEIHGGRGGYQRGQAESFSATAGKNSASLRDGRLTVNGKGYGRLNDGDSIVVEENGAVKINGAEQSPQ